MLNKTHAEHALIAAAIQLALWPLLGLLAGGVVACAVLLGREIAQHEYKLIRERGGREHLNWYSGTIHHWTTDSVLDVVVPAAACLTVFAADSLI